MTIQTKAATDDFRSGWDRVFSGKQADEPQPVPPPYMSFSKWWHENEKQFPSDAYGMDAARRMASVVWSAAIVANAKVVERVRIFEPNLNVQPPTSPTFTGVFTMPNQTCDKCKHWLSPSCGDFAGECGAAKSYISEELDCIACLGGLLTGPKFGCIKWSAK